jgi:2-oxoglutarate/2-oxoacid ferredoxin oxidoreductase subunit beta
MRKDNPIIWCKGCGMYSILSQVEKTLKDLKLKNSVAVSGIGCAGRSSGYFDLDSVNTLHGRAIPVAEGIKRANDKSNVFVFSGDGDLLGIGLNHLIHCSRRNTKLVVICANNNIYGMTGGQASPTTQKGRATKTSPEGMEFEPLNIQKILMSNKKYFYARTTPYNPQHQKEIIEKAFKHDGFAFVDVHMPCITNLKRTLKKSIPEIVKPFREDYKVVEENRELEDDELGVNTQ